MDAVVWGHSGMGRERQRGWVMDRAVKHTAPPTGEESPDLEALLKAGSFQQRLEQARIRGEQALAESGRDPEKELSGLSKP